MKKMIILFMVLFLGLQNAPSQTSADAVRIRQNEIGFGARALAMGGNGVALANDYSALYWNPAGLASLKQGELFADFSHLQFGNQAIFAGSLSDVDENFTRLRSLGMAVPLPTTRGSFVLAFGYNFVRDFDEYLYFNGVNPLSNGLEFELEDANGNYQWYPFDKDVKQTEELTDEGGLHQWSFGTAIAMSPNFDLGISANFWRGKDNYDFMFFQQDDANRYSTFPGDFESYTVRQNLITDFSAFNLKLGGMFKLNRAMRLGIAVEFPTTFTVTENYSSSDELVFDDGYVDAVEDEPGEWQYQVKTPYRLDAGIGVNSGLLKLTAAATYQDWSQTRFVKPEHASLDEDYGSLLEENRFIRQDYRETLNYHLGGELALPGSNMYLRGGYAVYPSPLKDANSDMDKKYYSGGVGFKISPNVRLDATFLRGNWSRQSEDSYTPGGTLEEITENRVFLGIKYNF